MNAHFEHNPNHSMNLRSEKQVLHCDILIRPTGVPVYRDPMFTQYFIIQCQ